MAWKELSKDQKQKFILGLLVAATLFYGVKTFVLDGIVQKEEFATETVDDVSAKLADYRTRLEPGSAALARRLLDHGKEMVSITEKHLPPRGGEFAWAANKVYQLQQQFGLDVTKEDVGVMVRNAAAGPLLKDSTFVPYSMKAAFKGSFADVAGFVHGLEETYPFATVSRISLTSGETPEKHAVEIILQWPAWADPAELAALQSTFFRNPVMSSQAAFLLFLFLFPAAYAGPAPAETGAAKEGAAGGPAAASPLKDQIAKLGASRDPFWPPGYKPGKLEPAVVAEEPSDDLDLLALREGSKLNVQGRIKVGSKFLLILKGRAVGQGDIVDVTGKNGKIYKMRITAISQDNIQLEPLGKQP